MATKYDLPSTQTYLDKFSRFQYLFSIPSADRSASEQTEYTTLQGELNDYLVSATDFNNKLETTGKAADSDKLDGLEATDFVKKDGTVIMTGNLQQSYDSATGAVTHIIKNTHTTVSENRFADLYLQGNNATVLGHVRAGTDPANTSYVDFGSWSDHNVNIARNGMLKAQFSASDFRIIYNYLNCSNGHTDGTLRINQIFSAGTENYPDTYTHKIETSHSGVSAANNIIKLSVCDGTASGFREMLYLSGAGDGRIDGSAVLTIANTNAGKNYGGNTFIELQFGRNSNGSVVINSATYATTNGTIQLSDFKFLWETELANGKNIYFEAVLYATAGTAYASLLTVGGATVASSEVSTASASPVRVRSGAVTLVDDAEYCIQLKGQNAVLCAARLIIK